MAMHIGEQTVLSNGQVHDGPAPGGLSTSDRAVAENPTTRDAAAEPVASEQASTQQQDGGTTAPRVRPSGSGLDLLFPNLDWTRPGTSSLLDGPGSDSTGSGSVRKQRIPYVLPVDSASGVPEGHLGFSSALGGAGDMPSVLMYAPERALTSTTADSMDVIPEHLILCVEEDAFERAWVAPQGYWRSAF